MLPGYFFVSVLSMHVSPRESPMNCLDVLLAVGGLVCGQLCASSIQSDKLPPRAREDTDQNVDACVNSKVLESACGRQLL